MSDPVETERSWDYEAQAIRIAAVWSFLLSCALVVKHVLIPGESSTVWLPLAAAVLSLLATMLQQAGRPKIALAVLAPGLLVGTVLGIVTDQPLGPIVWTVIAVISLMGTGRAVWAAAVVTGVTLLLGGTVLLHPGSLSLDAGTQTFWALTFSYLTALFYIHHTHALSRFKAQHIAELHERQRLDALTGALNRRGFNEIMGGFPRNIHPNGNALLLLDLDDFKCVNDTHGHPFGDMVLMWLVDILRSQIRKDDRLARLGGDEFAVILAGTSIFEATGIANRIQTAIANNRIIAPDGTAMAINASVGLAHCADPESCTPAKMLGAADQALYEAKRTKVRFVTLDVSADPSGHAAEKAGNVQTASA